MNATIQAGVSPSPTLTVDDLYKNYPGKGKNGVVEAVRGISFSVAPGELFGILGPNGAGKSTILGCITTLITPTSGTIHICGIDTTGNPSLVKRKIAVVPQERNLDQSLSVREILTYHGRYFGLPASEREERADRLLEELKLKDKADARAKTLSGGTQQRVMIARALMHDPRLLLLDEPTTGLDPQVRRQIWELLEELHANGLTIILTTHYMEEADQLCERLAIIDSGHLLTLDTPRALKRKLRSEQILELAVGSSLPLVPSLTPVPGISRVETLKTNDDGHQHLRLFLDSADGVVDEILTIIRREHFDLRHFSLAPPTLEDVYIQLTGKDLRE